jgi:hypothetical protein
LRTWGWLINGCRLSLGFDGRKDCPVELLHVHLLGIVRYLTRDFMSQLKPGQITRLAACYQTFRTDGLNIPTLRATYMTNHFASFIGKDFKVVLQAAPFVFFLVYG